MIFLRGLKSDILKIKSDISGILGVNWGDGREVQEGGDICILSAELTVLYSRNQHDIIKQLSSN